MEEWDCRSRGSGKNGRLPAYQWLRHCDFAGKRSYVITVGAMKTMGTPSRVDDLVASYSSKGPTAIDAIAKPDLVAPGNLLVSLEAPGSTLYNQHPGKSRAVQFTTSTEAATLRHPAISRSAEPAWRPES